MAMNDAPVNWFDARLPLRAWYARHWRDRPLPANLAPIWSFGILVAAALAILTLSGIWLGMAYIPGRHAALSMVVYTRTIPFGWLIADLHRVGATMLFGVVYAELFRGIYFATYRNRRELVWIIEIVRFAFFLTIGFFGFVMLAGPTAQSAILIMADHLAALPLFGRALAQDFLGGAGLNRLTPPHMAMSHYAIGFLVLVIAALGALATYFAPPPNPDGIFDLHADDFVHRSTYARQLFAALLIFALIFALILTVSPGLGYPIGPILPAPMALPLQVVPPWFLLAFHGFARAGGTPGWGTLLTIAALVLLGALPWLDRGTVAGPRYRPVYAGFVVLLAVDVVLLSIAAAQPARGAWPAVIDLATLWFFVHFLIVTPLVTRWERPHPVPTRLSGRVI